LIIDNLKNQARVITLALCVGVLPFFNIARTYASEKVGLTYGVSATVQNAYIWRGLRAGGMNMQIDANVGYGGLYADMWWNLGATDWSFTKFQPEVDLTVGFNRWGLNVYLLYIHNFNCGLFDGGNYVDKGNRLELNARYTVSKTVPLTFVWATRVAASDGYTNAAGKTARAYSSYAEINYNQPLPYGLSIYTAVGITPWRSCYTGYEKNFAVNNVEMRLRKDWTVHKHLGMMLMGQICVNPYAHKEVINANLALGIYLK
jgi:hypothetical protein